MIARKKKEVVATLINSRRGNRMIEISRVEAYECMNQVEHVNFSDKKIKMTVDGERKLAEAAKRDGELLQQSKSKMMAALTVNELLQELRTRVYTTGSIKEMSEKDRTTLDEIHKLAKAVGSESLVSLLAFAYGKKVMFENITNQEGKHEK